MGEPSMSSGQQRTFLVRRTMTFRYSTSGRDNAVCSRKQPATSSVKTVRARPSLSMFMETETSNSMPPQCGTSMISRDTVTVGSIPASNPASCGTFPRPTTLTLVLEVIIPNSKDLSSPQETSKWLPVAILVVPLSLETSPTRATRDPNSILTTSSLRLTFPIRMISANLPPQRPQSPPPTDLPENQPRRQNCQPGVTRSPNPICRMASGRNPDVKNVSRAIPKISTIRAAMDFATEEIVWDPMSIPLTAHPSSLSSSDHNYFSIENK